MLLQNSGTRLPQLMNTSGFHRNVGEGNKSFNAMSPDPLLSEALGKGSGCVRLAANRAQKAFARPQKGLARPQKGIDIIKARPQQGLARPRIERTLLPITVTFQISERILNNYFGKVPETRITN